MGMTTSLAMLASAVSTFEGCLCAVQAEVNAAKATERGLVLKSEVLLLTVLTPSRSQAATDKRAHPDTIKGISFA
jgi:hypothetical protein